MRKSADPKETARPSRETREAARSHDRRRSTATAGAPRRGAPPGDLLDRCRRYLAENTPRKALKALAEHCRKHPEDSEGHLLRAEARLAAGDRAGALEVLVEAMRIGGRAVESSLVRFLVDGGLFEEADALIEARIKENRDPERWLAYRAEAALAAGRYLDAQEAIDDLYAAGRTDAPVRAADYLQALLWTALGDAGRLGGLAERLEARGATAVHVAFVRSALRLLDGGSVEAFLMQCETTAAAFVEGRERRGAAADLAALLRAIRPDWFRPPRTAERGRLRRFLGSCFPEAGVSSPQALSPEDVELVREVFPGAHHVHLDPIEAGPNAGRSGDLVFRARPEYPNRREHSSLVKIGAKHRIAFERLRLERFVVGRIHPRHYPAPRGYACSYRRAALRSTWAVPDHEEVAALSAMHGAPPDRATTERLEALLEGLVREVLRPWYVENAYLETASPAEAYRLSGLGDAIERAVASLGVETSDGRLAVDGLKAEWWPPDPRPLLPDALRAAEREGRTWFGVVHGDLNLRNVLAGRSGAGGVSSLCLIDFYKAGEGPVLADVARLEVDLRHDADAPPEGVAPLEEALRDERAYLDGVFVDAPALGAEIEADCRLSVERIYRAVRTLRRAAAESAREVGVEPSRIEYLCALAAATAALLGYGSLGRTRRLLALAALARTVAALAGSA